MLEYEEDEWTKEMREATMRNGLLLDQQVKTSEKLRESMTSLINSNNSVVRAQKDMMLQQETANQRVNMLIDTVRDLVDAIKRQSINITPPIQNKEEYRHEAVSDNQGLHEVSLSKSPKLMSGLSDEKEYLLEKEENIQELRSVEEHINSPSPNSSQMNSCASQENDCYSDKEKNLHEFESVQKASKNPPSPKKSKRLIKSKRDNNFVYN
ncbi:hypothetical protein TKK_0011687 [Trichogramma kaykai]